MDKSNISSAFSSFGPNNFVFWSFAGDDLRLRLAREKEHIEDLDHGLARARYLNRKTRHPDAARYVASRRSGRGDPGRRALESLVYGVPTADQMRAEIDRRCGLQASGSMLPFTIVENASGQAVGMTTYMNIDHAAKRVEIGSTWYRKRVQRGPLNTECKLVLLRHAFEALDCIAVEFRTHFFNHASRRAIERLGAKMDGVLRNHQVMADGTLRDTCCYSIIESEWPAVKTHLTYQMNKPRS